MDLEPLREFVARHNLQTEPAYSLLDITAQLGKLTEELLRETNYGQSTLSPLNEESQAKMKAKIGDLMFAVAYLSTLYDADPEAELWKSVRRFEEKLERGT